MSQSDEYFSTREQKKLRMENDLSEYSDRYNGQLFLIVCKRIIFYRSNLVGTKFTCFDGGQNPKKGGVLSDGSNVREELCAVIYVSHWPCSCLHILPNSAVDPVDAILIFEWLRKRREKQLLYYIGCAKIQSSKFL